MKKMRLVAILLVLSMFAIIFTGCTGGKDNGDDSAGGGTASAAPGTETSPGNEVSGKDSIHIGIAYLPNTLDPQGYDDQITESILSNVYDPIVRVDAQGEIVPGGAENWEISDDGMEYTFYLYEGATFHDGSPVTAEDAKLTVERCMDSPVVGTYFQYIDYAEVVDELTLKVYLKSSYAPFLALLGAYGGIVSKDYIESSDNPFVTECIGSGPYKYADYMQGDKFILVAHDNYPTGKAPIENLVYEQITNASSASMALEAGELDLIVNVAAEDIDRLKDDPAIEVDEIQSLMSTLLQFNCTAPPFDDIRVRQAFAHAINKDDVIIGATNGLGVVADAHIPEGVPGYLPELSSPEYDLQKAKDLLAEAGYEDGLNCTITISQAKKAHTEVIQANLREAGIIAEIELLEAAAYYEAKVQGSFEVFVGGWGYICMDPDVYVYDMYRSDCVTSGNYGMYDNPEVDELLQEGRDEPDAEKRQKIYEDMGRITLEEVPNIPIMWNAANLAYNKDLKGVEAINTEQYFIYRYSW